MKLDLSMDEIVINTNELKFNELKPTIERAMSDVLADHGRKYDAKQKPDGSAQKANEEPYRSRKANPGIRVGGRLVRGEVPTVLTGEMKSSRQVRTRGESVEAFFSGRENAIKARNLINKGYGLHFFSPDNIKLVERRVSDGIDTDELIKVKRGRRRP